MTNVVWGWHATFYRKNTDLQLTDNFRGLLFGTMNETQILFNSLLKLAQSKGETKGYFTPRDKRELKDLDALAEMEQDNAEGDDFVFFFDFRNKIAELLDSELALFA
jgi:hypothetical protein